MQVRVEVHHTSETCLLVWGLWEPKSQDEVFSCFFMYSNLLCSKLHGSIGLGGLPSYHRLPQSTADHHRLPQTNVHVHRRPKKIAGKRKIDDFHAN